MFVQWHGSLNDHRNCFLMGDCGDLRHCCEADVALSDECVDVVEMDEFGQGQRTPDIGQRLFTASEDVARVYTHFQ